MNKNKILAFAISAAVLAAMTGCGGDKTPAETEAPAETTAASAAAPAVTEPAVPTEPVDLEAGVTDAMYARALISEGDKTRVASFLRRLKNGEDLKVGFIGGSITQGTAASSSDECYASRIWQGLSAKCGGNSLEYVNAGIGATDSYTGVHRIERDLFKDGGCPDLVFVEFSVNDTNNLVNKESYDSLVRRILSQPNNPAVILIFTTQENGTSLVDTHMEIGKQYDLPMLSYKNIVFPEVQAGTLDWKAISPDNIHPNSIGHGFIAEMAMRYLNGVEAELDSISEEPSAFDAEPLTKDIYANAHMLNSNDITAETCENFEIKTVDSNFPDGWSCESGGTLVFKDVEFSNFGVMFRRSPSGNLGKYEVYIDGEKKGTIDGSFPGGWGSYAETKVCSRYGELAKHTVEIKPAPGCEDMGCEILALMVS